MKLSMEWLRDYCDVSDIEIKTYCDKMTMTGSKVEGWEEISGGISGVVCGHILTCEKHPDADRLTVCSVDTGGASPIQIVTAAVNMKPGDKVPVALDGANLPGGVKIKRGKLRGIESNGMFCSIEELALTEHDMPAASRDGLFILNDCGFDDIQPGEDVLSALSLRGLVVEFEITPNRPDCLSVIGLARESAVSFGRELTLHEPVIKDSPDGDSVGNYIKVAIDDDKLCPRYSAAVVKNVRIEPSPLWMRLRLRASGVRPINNIVDITNYVMLEYGQPMHAFDYKCLDGQSITVRRAADSEEFISLDDKAHTLDNTMLVIADEKKPVALAGVMGGANSEITNGTSTVVFESANFMGASVRVSAKKLGMRTESSARFEKGMDAENTIPALRRALELVQALSAGEVVNGIIDLYPGRTDEVKIKLECEKIRTFLGMDIPDDFMIKTLESLDFKVKGDIVTVPSYRADVLCMNDLAEEVMRIYGYDKITSSVFGKGIAEGRRTLRQRYDVSVRDALCGMGYDEIQTFSFVSPKNCDKINMAQDDLRRRAIVISNPLGEDTSVMRTTALASMLDILSGNYAVKNRNVKLFEMASVYLPTKNDELPEEPHVLTLGFYTDVRDGSAFYKIKGVIEALFELSGITGASFAVCSDNTAYHPGRCASIMKDKARIGVFGEIHPNVSANYGIDAAVYSAELDFDAMFALCNTEGQYSPLPRYPAVERDLSFVCDEELPVGEIEAVMSQAAGKTVRSIELFDIYRGAQVGDGKKSVSFALTLRRDDGTMTDEDADRTIAKILKRLESEFGIVLRS